MAEQKMLSEVEAVKRERAAYLKGIRDRTCPSFPSWTTEAHECRAARFFPMPKVLQHRVLSLGNLRFRVVDGRLQWSTTTNNTWCWDTITAAGLASSLETLASNPTELVEADA